MRFGAILVVAALALAGCTQSNADESSPDTPLVEAQYEDPSKNFTVDAPVLPTNAPAPGERTADAAPVLRLGEWWKIRLTEHFTGESWEIMRVVAGSERGDYLVGFPVEEFSNNALVMHTPGFGDIKSDLSYAAHDVPFVPVQWPIVEGDSWVTAWEAEGATLEMTVTEISDNGTATILGSPLGGGYPTEIIYNFEMGEVQKLTMSGYADYEVIEHGFNFEGDVRVPHDHDLVFMHGRFAGVQQATAPTSPNPSAPTETIAVEGGYDRISFALLMYDFGALATGTNTPAGYYSVKLTAPDGTVFGNTMDPTHGNWLKASFHGHEGPVGDWQLEAIAAGGGAAFAEGIGYHSIDIALPSGCVLDSMNAGHHGALCRDGRDASGLP